MAAATDNPASIDATFDKLKRYYLSYADFIQSSGVEVEQQRARDYYDGNQWTAAERAKLNARQQPVITFNYLAPKVNFLLGCEIRARVDPKAYPRTPAHESDVKAITDALRYVAYEQCFDQHRSALTKELLIPGCGAVVLCVDTEAPERPEIKLRFIPSDRFIYDPHSSYLDYRDAFFLGCDGWWDADTLKSEPQYEGASSTLAGMDNRGRPVAEIHLDRPELWFDPERSRVKVIEICWREGRDWWLAHFCYAGFLYEPVKSPYLDDKGQTTCPVIGATAFITRDNARYGMLRNLLDCQDEINKRRSKAMWDMLVSGAVAERSAVLNPTEFLTQVKKPDGLAIVEDGALAENRVLLREHTDMAQGQLAMLQEAKQTIGDIGPSLASVAGEGGDSGRAIMARQNISSIEMEPIFDQLRSWEKRVFEAIWFSIRQFWTNEIWLRVTDSEQREGYRFVGLNRRMTRAQRLQELMGEGMPLESAIQSLGMESFEVAQVIAQATQEAQAIALQKAGGQLTPEQAQQAQPIIQQLALEIGLQSPVMQQPFIASNVAELNMDVLIESAPDIATIQQEQFELLVDMASKGLFNAPPDMQELLIEASQLRDKDKLLGKIKAMRENPQAAQAQQMQMQAQMQTMQLAMQKLVAEIEEIKSQTVLNLAKAQAEPAKSAGEQAYAITTMVDAGRKSVPQAPQAAPSTNKMRQQPQRSI